MNIAAVINNNVVSAYDGDYELVVMGRGIGFGRSAGQALDPAKIEKIFRIDNSQTRNSFKSLIEDMPLDYLRISDAVITKAKKKLGTEMSQNVYITLTDHISFALDRYKKGLSFQNSLQDEVITFYPDEYRIGREAVEMIREATDIQLPEAEAVSIALHIVNAEYCTSVNELYKVSQLMQTILHIVQQEYSDNKTINYNLQESFGPYVKRLCLRVFQGKMFAVEDPTLYSYVENNYSREKNCINKIDACIWEKHRKHLTDNERTCLILQLRQVRGSQSKE